MATRIQRVENAAIAVAVDRALGYGLKLDERFTHTHLGRIGPRRRGERGR